MKNLKPTNRYRKVLIENIVFLQGDDYESYDDIKNANENLGYEWSDINYLLQWYYPDKHETIWYGVDGINTEFLGKLIKIPGYTGYFLFSKNTRIGYIGLSRVVEFSMKIID